MKWTPTSSQTVGPFFSIGLAKLHQNTEAALADWPGGKTLQGVVRDGDQKPIPDCVLEFFAEGFFARVATDKEGKYKAILPPAMARCEVLVFMRGLLKPALTRLYLDNEILRTDAALRNVPKERLTTLAAQRTSGQNQFEWNIAMQGANETVFFDC